MLAAIAALLSGCSLAPVKSTRQIPHQTSWSYADLRLLDPADAPEAAHDLLAVYLSRPAGRQSPIIDIRLDFLELSIRNQPDVYIALDYTNGGGSQLHLPARTDLAWDALLFLPAAGEINAVDSWNQPIPGLPVRVIRDAELDSLDIRMDASALFSYAGSITLPEFKMQVFINPAGSHHVSDTSAIARSFDPPPDPANLLLAFWNTYPAYTPAQSLRRWDGAHTGPLGGRHGLSNLLRTADNSDIPVVLMDLKYPAWLSALDYGGDLEMVKHLISQGSIFLPEVLPPVDDTSWHQYSAKLTRQFDLPTADYAYTQSYNHITDDYSLLFFPFAQSSPVTTIRTHDGQRQLPLPILPESQSSLQPDLNGLSVEQRRWLIDTAVNGDSSQIVALGGDLGRSSWGSPQIARAAFQYIRNHPWIRPLFPRALLSLPAVDMNLTLPLESSPVFAELPRSEGVDRLVMNALDQHAHPAYNSLIQAAAQAYLALAPPATPASPEYTSLQQIYARQVNILLAAADWSQNPVPVSSCSLDIDRDGQPECVLASERMYAVIEPRLGDLTYAFAIDETGVHQLIAPTSQFTFGTGDPSTWDMQLDLAADPQVIPGAFYDGGGPYQVELFDTALTLSSAASGRTKFFTLLPDGLRYEVVSSGPEAAHIPLALDPWQRFAPGWACSYHGESIPGGWSWSMSPGFNVSITTDARYEVAAFTDTSEMMNRVENPNTEFPPGHYLPFPVSSVEFPGGAGFWLGIRY
jgi:hypothetical protein